MKVAKEKIKDLKYNLAFVVSSDDFEKELETQILDFAQNHKEKGFRKGHVPVDVIKSKYENHFINDVLNSIVNKSVSEYCKDKKITPVSNPKLTVDEFVRGKDIKFSVEFEILPEIKDIDFSKITVTKKIAIATDREVNDSLKNIADSRHTLKDVVEKRVTKNGDVVDINFVGSVDGVEFKGGKADNHMLELGSHSFIDNFEDQLLKKNVGDELDVNVKFPKDYGEASLAGKKAVFKVKINAIKEKIVPEINDEFAKQLNRKDLADLKIYVKELLDKNYETTAKNIMKSDLLEKLGSESFDVPEVLVEQELDYMMYQFKNLDQKAQDKKRDELKKQAVSRVKLGLVLAEIGKKEKLQITEQDIQNAVMQEAMKYPTQAKQIFEYYTKNQNALETLKAGAFEEKVLDFILGKVTVKEKKVDPKDLIEKE